MKKSTKENQSIQSNNNEDKKDCSWILELEIVSKQQATQISGGGRRDFGVRPTKGRSNSVSTRLPNSYSKIAQSLGIDS